MLDIKFMVNTPMLKADPIARNSALLATALGASYASAARTVLTETKKVVTRKTINSVASELILDSSSRGIFRRQVTAAKSWFYIQWGRRPGRKMPIRKVGDKFEPVPELIEWFKALNIPQAAWMPICRKIARDGIKPTKITEMTMMRGLPRLGALCAIAGENIARDLIKEAQIKQTVVP